MCACDIVYTKYIAMKPKHDVSSNIKLNMIFFLEMTLARALAAIHHSILQTFPYALFLWFSFLEFHFVIIVNIASVVFFWLILVYNVYPIVHQKGCGDVTNIKF